VSLVALADFGLGELFGDDCSQPDAADGEPVFRPVGGGRAFTDDDFAQADAADSV